MLTNYHQKECFRGRHSKYLVCGSAEWHEVNNIMRSRVSRVSQRSVVAAVEWACEQLCSGRGCCSAAWWGPRCCCSCSPPASPPPPRHPAAMTRSVTTQTPCRWAASTIATARCWATGGAAIYTLSTHYLHTIYTLSTHYLHTIVRYWHLRRQIKALLPSAQNLLQFKKFYSTLSKVLLGFLNSKILYIIFEWDLLMSRTFLVSYVAGEDEKPNIYSTADTF